MMVQVAWTPPRGGAIEPTVPLVWHGERLRRLQWDHDIVLVFMEGLSRLPADYRRQLTHLGYELIDAEALSAEARRQHPNLASMPLTNQYWFLRWNVMHRLVAAGQLSLPLVHLDGDVVLMAPPREIAQDVLGKTFVLQGSPCFASIADPAWFVEWERGLREFHDHPEATLAHARRMQTSPVRKDREFCNDCAYDLDRTWHDQDLMEMMIAAGTLRQARSDDVFRSRYFWMHNPLQPCDWAAEQEGATARGIRHEGPQAWVGSRAVPFYHFQGDFLRLCRWWLALQPFGLEELATLAHPRHPRHRRSLANAAALKWERVMRQSRREIYQRVYAGTGPDECRPLHEIVNHCWQRTEAWSAAAPSTPPDYAREQPAYL